MEQVVQAVGPQGRACTPHCDRRTTWQLHRGTPRPLPAKRPKQGHSRRPLKQRLACTACVHTSRPANTQHNVHSASGSACDKGRWGCMGACLRPCVPWHCTVTARYVGEAHTHTLMHVASSSSVTWALHGNWRASSAASITASPALATGVGATTPGPSSGKGAETAASAMPLGASDGLDSMLRF